MYTKGTVSHKEDVPKKTIDHGQMEDWLNRIWPKVEIVGKYLKFLILSINILGRSRGLYGVDKDMRKSER